MISTKQIHDICDQYKIENYTINPDGSIDVDGDVNLSYMGLTKIPIKFNKVSGYFDCSYNFITSLEGCPREVVGNFFCSGNEITSLEGGPEIVYGKLYCNFNNSLITTKGFPSIVSNDVSIIFCHKLTSLEDYNLSYEKLDIDNKEKLIRKLKLEKLIREL